MDFLAAVGEPFADRCGIMVRSDTLGTVYAVIDGSVVGSATTDPAVKDGCAYFTVRCYDRARCTVTHSSGGTEILTLRTLPDADESWSFGIFGCYQKETQAWFAAKIVERGCRFAISAGDNGYMTQGLNAYGENYAAAHNVDFNDAAAALENVYQYQRQFWKVTDIRALARVMPLFVTFDDHECRGDNWDHTLGRSNAKGGIAMTTQAQVDEHYRICNMAFRHYWPHNPANTDPEAIAVKPSNADPATPVANYQPTYWRKRFGNVVEIFTLDAIAHRSPFQDADTISKQILGPAQEQWIVNCVRNSPCKFKIIVSSKDVYGNYNQDGFAGCISRRDILLKQLLVPEITGLVWLTQDNHHPHISQAKAGVTQYADGSFYQADLLVVCGAPANGAHLHFHPMLSGYGDSMRKKMGGNESNEVVGAVVWTAVDVTPDSLTVSLVRPDGSIWYSATLAPGSNVATPVRPQAGKVMVAA